MTKTIEANKRSSERKFVLTRIFNAQREQVFKAFTEEKHLRHWWGPKGFKIIYTSLDFRPGGIFHYGMLSPDGMEVWGKFSYIEIVSPVKIVLINSFSDKDGNLTRHPMAPEWPQATHNIWEFEENDGKTTVTIRARAYNASEQECKIFEDGFDSMEKGNAGMFDQLDEYLSKNITQ